MFQSSKCPECKPKLFGVQRRKSQLTWDRTADLKLKLRH